VISLPALESSIDTASCYYCWKFKMRSPWSRRRRPTPRGPCRYTRRAVR